MKNNINCIILCAGSGSRMKDDSKNKVCFEIMGKPAVVRVIESLKECGIEKFIVVVGNKCESVMSAVAGIEGVTFAYQKEQSGTGNAAMCGLKVINEFDIEGPVLTVMGDKLIDKSVFEMLINDFYSNKSDISLITQPSDFNRSGGKIVLYNGKVTGIVEHLDFLLLNVKEEMKKGKTKEAVFAELNLNEKQISKINGKLANSNADESFIEINGIKFSSEDITASQMVNCATYLHSRKAINDSIYGLTSDNAQNEIYFTDTVKNISQKGKVTFVNVTERKLIQTFNTMEELENINNFFKGELN